MYSYFIHPVSRGSLSFPFPPSLHHPLFSLGIASLIIIIVIPTGNTRPPSLARYPSPHLLSSLAIIIIPLSGPTPQIMHNPPLLAHSPSCVRVGFRWLVHTIFALLHTSLDFSVSPLSWVHRIGPLGWCLSTPSIEYGRQAL